MFKTVTFGSVTGFSRFDSRSADLSFFSSRSARRELILAEASLAVKYDKPVPVLRLLSVEFEPYAVSGSLRAFRPVLQELPYVFKFELGNRLFLYDSAGLGSRDRDRMYNDELAGLMSRVRTDETLNRRPIVVTGLGSRARLIVLVMAGLWSRFRIVVETSKVERRSAIGLASLSLGLLQRLLVEEYLDGFVSEPAVVAVFAVPYFVF